MRAYDLNKCIGDSAAPGCRFAHPGYELKGFGQSATPKAFA
jgi:hypothetical protein